MNAVRTMSNAPESSLPTPAVTWAPLGWKVLMLLLAAGSASAATLLDAFAPLLIVVGLACLVWLERAWRL